MFSQLSFDAVDPVCYSFCSFWGVYKNSPFFFFRRFGKSPGFSTVYSVKGVGLLSAVTTPSR